MAGIGLSKNFIAKYACANGVVSYSGGTSLGPATEFSSEIEMGKNTDLYGDNGIQETARAFSGGTLTHGTTELTQEGSALILGILPKEITIGTKKITELVYDDMGAPPYLGYGTIIKKQVGGVYKWRAVILTKIIYDIPKDSAATNKGTITWETPTLTATFMRDDTPAHVWKREATFATEAEAEAYIKNVLNFPAAPV